MAWVCLCLQQFEFSVGTKDHKRKSAMQRRLETYQQACFLACESKEAVVLYDDLHDRLEDNPTFIRELGLEQAEVDRIRRGLRRIMDRSYDFMNRLSKEMEQGVGQPVVPAVGAKGPEGQGAEREGGYTAPACEAEAAASDAFTLDQSWRKAEEAHKQSPTVLESALLPKPQEDSQKVSIAEGQETEP